MISATNDITVSYSPNKIVFGVGASKEVGKEVKALGGTKVQIVTDKIMVDLDLIRPVIESLEENKIPYVVYDGVLPDAPVRLMLQALEQFKAEGCDLTIGFGGGSSLDSAKGVALMSTNGTDVKSMLEEMHAVKKRGCPNILMPTTNVAGADSGFAIVLTLDEKTHEHGIIVSNYAMPDVIISDPLLTVTMPQAVTADTGIDVLATGIECLTAKTATVYSDLYAEKVVSLSSKYLPMVCAKGTDIEARSNMAFAATISGHAYMSSWLGAIHGLSYPIAAACELSHGRSLGAILPHVMRYNLPGNPEKFCRVAELMGKDISGLTPLKGAEKSVEAVEELLDMIGVSYRLKDYGITKKNMTKLSKEGLESMEEFHEVFVVPNAKDMNVNDIKNIYTAAF